MISSLVAFFTSFFFTILIIRTQNLHGSISGDKDLDGPQKFHAYSVPRIGGLAIGLGLFASITLNNYMSSDGQQKIILFCCALPAFGIGLLEDLTKRVGIRTRLVFSAFSGFFAYIFMNAKIVGVDIPIIDISFSIPAISILFTTFAITGLSNSYNIIDGFNGLSSMIGIISLVALGYMGIKFNDPIIYFLSFTMASAILGFFLLNYPRGLIFLGDGGAYLIGFWVATLSIMVVSRHPEISPWFALLLNAYPIFETLFTIYRRKFHQNKSPGHPDGIHFHSLIFRRILNRGSISSEFDWLTANSRTSPYLWVLSALAIAPAVIFFNSTPILIISSALFCLSYLWLYKSIVRFQTPRWMSG